LSSPSEDALELDLRGTGGIGAMDKTFCDPGFEMYEVNARISIY
jgi:hypothetical protein